MPNILTGLVPTIYEALDVVGRELVGVIPSVSTDHSIERAAVGQTVMSPVAPPVSLVPMVPGVTAPNNGDQTIGNVSMTITRSETVPIRWNGEENRGINSGVGTAPVFRDQLVQGMRAFANAIEIDLMLEARRNASRAYGTVGTVPFGVVNDLTDSSEAIRIIEENGGQGLERSLVLSTAAMSNIRGKQAVLFRANEAGTDALLRQGVIGELHGSRLRQTAASTPVVKGTGAGYTTSGAAALPIGAMVIPVITGTGTILAGDIVTFAGDSNKYVVAIGASGPGNITLNMPGLRVAQAAAAVAVTVGNNFTPSLLFAKSAMVLASRAPALPMMPDGAYKDMADERLTITDPLTGLNFELSMYTQYRQIRFELALAWGVKAVKAEHIAMLIS
jgi:P22 coat protein - gene protein 5